MDILEVVFKDHPTTDVFAAATLSALLIYRLMRKKGMEM